MSKSRDAFRTISEVSDALDTPAHVLRFWESKFKQVKPVKRAGGRRYYRPADVDLLAGIKKLLHDDGMTIKGAQKLMREQGVKHVAGLGADALPDISQTVDATADPTDVSQPSAAETSGAVPDVAPIPAVPSAVTAPDDAQIAKSAPEDYAPSDDDSDIPEVASYEAAPEPTSDAAASRTHIEDTSDAGPTPEQSEVASAAEEAPTDPIWRSVPSDPADSDSKADARLFHLLQRTDASALAKQAGRIAPLLARMQTLRDRISPR